MRIIAIIPSGGSGSRVSSAIPKQYIQFHGKELLAYTLDVFNKSNLINEIVVSAQEEFFQLLESIKLSYNYDKLLPPVKGGNSRQESVYNAIRSLQCEDNDIIVVHDAARPLLSIDILEKSITETMKYDAAVVCIKAKDTLMRSNNNFSGDYIDRDNVFYVQTPQSFKFRILSEAIISAFNNNFIGTDESMLVRKLGFNIKIVQGSSLNFKITDDSDIQLFNNLVKNLC